MSTYANGIYGLVIMLLFTLVITVGFAYELLRALYIDSRQYNAISKGSLGSKLNAPFVTFVGILLPLRVMLMIDSWVVKVIQAQKKLGLFLVSLWLSLVTSYFRYVCYI
jgi:hypothetical protein